MNFHLNFSQQAQSDIEFHKKVGKKAILKKLHKEHIRIKN